MRTWRIARALALAVLVIVALQACAGSNRACSGPPVGGLSELMWDRFAPLNCWAWTAALLATPATVITDVTLVVILSPLGEVAIRVLADSMNR